MSARMTLLEMTQNILSAMDSDEVNSISDTVESLQVANEIVTTYYELFAARDLPSTKRLMTLEALSDVDHPNYMKIPDGVVSIEWIKYKGDEGEYVDVTYLEPVDFLNRANRFNTTDAVTPIGDLSNSSIIINVGIDQQPRFWTTFDNQYVVFNSLNLDLDSTLQESKSLVEAIKLPEFLLGDTEVPDLDTVLFPLLLSEAKKACFINFKGVSNANEERRARRQLVRTQNNLWRGDQRRPYNRTPNYGRRRR